ncbi:hypothetical protein SARC_06501 [Sphaeroforma arctica JP610]|uniref:Uncharacterized protein n=1 Tax=Sphaeroforma arctica JP610 TaxID=667725 RepID=A0A0L0FX94_9EUKA|nr:hypothetical protein SARC_06501 [Sphaeroforma arctica JP610]KNC81166.1 hypothetical protein SARC_06501 [Sphaeroforma arctica JP610]|eukprot:XP_014155068.1 hypothetical protein SARC_06501 [Sphaeroforma arctica JP610]
MTRASSTPLPSGTAFQSQNSAIPTICVGIPSILPVETSKSHNKFSKTTQDSGTIESGSENPLLKCDNCNEGLKCYKTYGRYSRSIWLWVKIIVFALISFGIAFGMSYWKTKRRHNGTAQFWSYSIFGEVCVSLIFASIAPFIAVPFVFGRLNNKRNISWLKPVKLEYVRRSRIRYIFPNLLSSKRWPSVLAVGGYLTIFATVPLLVVLGLVLEGNSQQINGLMWASIYGAWVMCTHTISFLIAFAWTTVHILKPVCSLKQAVNLIDRPESAK